MVPVLSLLLDHFISLGIVILGTSISSCDLSMCVLEHKCAASDELARVSLVIIGHTSSTRLFHLKKKILLGEITLS